METKKAVSIFIVDDDKMLLTALQNNIQEGFEQNDILIEKFETGEACLEKARSESPEIIILDYALNGKNQNAMNGIAVLNRLKSILPETEVVMLSSQDKLEVAVNSIKSGAYDYIVKSETALVRVTHLIKNIIKGNKVKRDWKRFEIGNWILASSLLILLTINILHYLYKI